MEHLWRTTLCCPRNSIKSNNSSNNGLTRLKTTSRPDSTWCNNRSTRCRWAYNSRNQVLPWPVRPGQGQVLATLRRRRLRVEINPSSTNNSRDSWTHSSWAVQVKCQQPSYQIWCLANTNSLLCPDRFTSPAYQISYTTISKIQVVILLIKCLKARPSMPMFQVQLEHPSVWQRLASQCGRRELIRDEKITAINTEL